MYLHETAIAALTAYRKQNGYTRTIRLCPHGHDLAVIECDDCFCQ